MALDSKLLTALRITSDEQILRLRNSYARHVTDDQINQELAELAALRPLVQAGNRELARRLGLQTTDDLHESWERYGNDLKMRETIVGDKQIVPRIIDKTDDTSTETESERKFIPYFEYGGREIETHIQGSSSTTQFNPEHVGQMVDSIKRAAIDVVAKMKIDEEKKRRLLADVETLYLEIKNGTTIPKRKTKARSLYERLTGRVQEAEIEGSQIDFSKNMELPNLKIDGIDILKQDFQIQMQTAEGLKDIVKRCVILNRLFIGGLAIIMWQAENPGKTIDELDIRTYDPYVKQIQNQEISNISNTKRPILVNVYKQKTKDPNVIQYIKTTQIPNSDESSASRGLENEMFSNDWTVLVEKITLTRSLDGKFTQKTQLVNRYKRSSSIALLVYDKPVNDPAKELDNREKVYEAYKKLIVQAAREKIIEKINGNEDVTDILEGNVIEVNEALISLLSPLVSKELGVTFTSRLGKMVTTKTIHENEDAQMEMVKYVAKKVRERRPFKFSAQDRAQILERTKHSENPARRLIDDQKLSKLNIRSRNYFCNYMVNKIGHLRSERVGSRKNRAYFKDGNVLRRQYIREYLAQSKELEGKDSLLRALDSAFDDERIYDQLEQITKEHAQALQDCPQVKKLIRLYMDVEKYFLQPPKVLPTKKETTTWMQRLRRGESYDEDQEQERIEQSYITAIKDAAIAQILGFDIRAFCKSGIDRTGLFASFVEAMVAEGLDSIDMERLEENIILSMQHGPNRLIKTINLVGVAGLQLSRNVLTRMKRLGQFLDEGLLRSIGVIGKVMYVHSLAIFELVKESVRARVYAVAGTGHAPPLSRQKSITKESQRPSKPKSVFQRLTRTGKGSSPK